MRFVKTPFNILELVVAIALFGLLAFAVIYAIDPVERAKQDRDELYKEQAKSILEAVEKYAIKEGRMPWIESEVGALAWTRIQSERVGLQNLVEEGLLSSSNEPEGVYLGKGKRPEDQVYACFIPESRALRVDYIPLFAIEEGEALPEGGIPEFCPESPDWQNSVCYSCVSRKVVPKK